MHSIISLPYTKEFEMPFMPLGMNWKWIVDAWKSIWKNEDVRNLLHNTSRAGVAAVAITPFVLALQWISGVQNIRFMFTFTPILYGSVVIVVYLFITTNSFPRAVTIFQYYVCLYGVTVFATVIVGMLLSPQPKFANIVGVMQVWMIGVLIVLILAKSLRSLLRRGR